MSRHGPNCMCGTCTARRISDKQERASLGGQTWQEQRRQLRGGGSGQSSGGPVRADGQCGDCGGTTDCIHCFNGVYPRRDGTSAPCGKCHGRTKCHACRGRGYGGRKCNTPTYLEMKARAERAKKGGWTPASSQPPDVGVVEGTDHIASFKTGGPNGDDTLIADGDYSDDPKGFNGPRGKRGHDHHGRWGSQRRGKYTGPGN